MRVKGWIVRVKGLGCEGLRVGLRGLKGWVVRVKGLGCEGCRVGL